ncbi:uroporphyrinogen-III synthase [Psychroflexus aestuariivivens]|uniref:uroporphyrinogen-III synthase n=1 Tax=Psychroflexus aestuariivivens TaxID=1795040 RepID=UPI000FDA2764|nr:uroporphyrinogen-III synthase [Psychroflexus aestuariivivens]
MPSVLSTKILTESQTNLLLNANLSLVQYNAIEIKPLYSPDHFHNVYFENAIVTSQKSVDFIKPAKIERCFCVGQKTAERLKNHGFKVEVIAEYGSDLAEVITRKYSDSKFHFFCSEQRRDELPSELKSQKVSFEEIHLYKTQPNLKKFHRNFDSILFFSPSAVKSFFEVNSAKHSKLICIGETTATCARKFSSEVYVAKHTSIESVIVKTVQVLKQ